MTEIDKVSSITPASSCGIVPLVAHDKSGNIHLPTEPRTASIVFSRELAGDFKDPVGWPTSNTFRNMYKPTGNVEITE